MSSVIEPVELEPYPAYRESGLPCIGEVPEHWEVRRFGVLAAGFRNGLTAPQLESGVTAHLVSRIETISKGIVDYAKVGYLTGEEDHSPYLLRTDDFLISHINSYAKVGNSARYGGERPLIHGMNLIRVTPLKSVAPAFLGYMLKSELFRGAMQRACKPAINQVSVTTTAIKAIYFPFPPFHEQAAIVRYLDDADQRIRAYVGTKERLIALLEEERQAVIHRAVTQGLDPNVKLKPSGVEWLGDVPEHWDVRRLKSFYTETEERSRTGLEELMSVSHKTGVTPRKQNVTMFLAETNEGYKVCRPGDIVVNTMWAYMAALGVSRQVGLVSPSYGVYRPIKQGIFNFEFVDALLRTEIYRTAYLMLSKGITESRLRLYADSFLGIQWILPPPEEQAAIVRHIDKATSEIDAAIDRARRQIELMEEYRTRLIADVVTGRIDVREA